MAQNQEQNQKKTQIIRKDGRNCLMELNTQSFSIGKVQFVFSKYDPNRPSGQRTTDRVVIYLNFAEALEWAQSILDGRFSKSLLKASKTFEQSQKPWDKDVVISMGGTPNKRSDGSAESRVLKAQLGTKNPVALIASSGPGTVNDTGLIVPTKGAQLDHSVMITLTAADIRQIAVMLKLHVEAYTHNEHIHNIWSYHPVQTNNNANNATQRQNAASNPNNQATPQNAGNANAGNNGGNYQNNPQQPTQPTQASSGYNINDEELPF